MNNPITLKSKCPHCGSVTFVTVDKNDYEDWQNGKFVQNAFPYLRSYERELFITGICKSCWENIFR